MHDTLFRFLIQNKKIDLPEIGTIVLHRQPARSEFVNRSFIPPAYTFALESNAADSSEKLISWVSTSEDISKSDAEVRLKNFLTDFKNQLESENTVTWNGVGTFRKQSTGEIIFQAFEKRLPFLDEVAAQKVIRENAEHTMLVGEVEKTSTQMSEILAGEFVTAERRSRWWLWPLAVVIVILIFLGWYFSEHGINHLSVGNNHKISTSTR